ncbi:MAG TPA: pentapeptide repeat-containing protein [Galbitalea sp.]|jgi:predicted CxxxxCH...CXXCH cytochrome family protein
MDELGSTLIADCARCVGLCCVALEFTRSEDFGFSKGDDEACRNLEADYRCRIHSALRNDGMRGCTVFDCHGAGQKVTQAIYAGSSWRDSASLRTEMFAVFRIVRQLHDMLWFLTAAFHAAEDRETRESLDAMHARIEDLSVQPGARVLTLDLERLRDEVNPLLAAVSSSVRSAASTMHPARVRAGADLVGANLAGADLRGADLRGAVLIAADLANADLRGADLISADLRDANLCGADLSTTLFVTQMQLNATRGDLLTALPPLTTRPPHWS